MVLERTKLVASKRVLEGVKGSKDAKSVCDSYCVQDFLSLGEYRRLQYVSVRELGTQQARAGHAVPRRKGIEQRGLGGVFGHIPTRATAVDAGM